ncbi:TonB-dependent receptor plug domain-containing protein [Novosphingobium pokkalii]|uniref:TonB-dependent receptor plug domain-containing protein n=1 Tax=Novosphingobium pokkalii TaxID=1770194 RepID=UPI00362FDF71
MKQVISARGAAVVALLSSTILGVPAYAQQQPSSQPDTTSPNAPAPGATASSPGGLPQADDARPGTADIVVTGSRISRRDTVANSPIATISGTTFNQTGAVTLEDTLNRLPQFSPGTGATSNDNLSGGITTLNLRGLGSNRTLVLMDGHRLPASTDLGAVDINIIPDALIESVETITGGASAAYGSDAIAGVVNFKINHRFSGIRLDAQNGISGRGDGYTFKTSATVGSNFSDGRGNAVLSIGYQQRDAVNNSDRAFSSIVRPSSSLPYGAFIVDADNQPSDAAVKASSPAMGSRQAASIAAPTWPSTTTVRCSHIRTAPSTIGAARRMCCCRTVSATIRAARTVSSCQSSA